MRYQIDISDTQIRDGLIQRFEFTYEISHKMIKRYLESASPTPQEYDAMPFADLIRSANEQSLLRSDWPTWRQYREMRSKTSHTYDEAIALEVVAAIPEFLQEAVELRDKRRIADIAQLKTENKLMQTAERERQLNNEAVMKEVTHYLSWRISDKDTLDGFRKVLKQTVFYLELALKRRLIEPDEIVTLKIKYSKEFLLDDLRAKKHFFSQQRLLSQKDKERLQNFAAHGVHFDNVVKTT